MAWGKPTSSTPSFLVFLGFCRASFSEACSDFSGSSLILSTGYRCWKEFVQNGGVATNEPKQGLIRLQNEREGGD